MNKITNMKQIRNSEKKIIGRINMITYSNSSEIPHVEYDLDDEYHNQGIMTKELIKYLEEYTKKGFNKLLAVVEEENNASKRVLEKAGFIKFEKIRKYQTYLYFKA